MITAAAAGFALAFSLILAIGAQNAFVLRQGLRGAHVFAVCLTCAVSDAVLILAGVLGLGALVELLPWLETAFRYAGAAFLTVYGAMAFRSAWKGSSGLQAEGKAGEALGPVLATVMALTWLNPHVYLDTLFLIGSVSTRYPDHQAAFAIGAMTSSFVFFFSLGYGARLLRPFFAKPASWRVLDVGVGVVMWTIALGLLLGG